MTNHGIGKIYFTMAKNLVRMCGIVNLLAYRRRRTLCVIASEAKQSSVQQKINEVFWITSLRSQ
jgi:hypothetical protein